MKVYAVEVKICATLYVRATDEATALKLAAQTSGDMLQVRDDGGSEIDISGAPLNDPALPEISLSPAMTCHGIWDDDTGAEEMHDEDEEG
jgi:hypothetical protein